MNNCKNCLISVTCTIPCKDYEPSVDLLNNFIEIKRAINFSKYYKKIILNYDNFSKVIIKSEVLLYLKNDKRHRDNDQPAIIRANGTKEWWINNRRHRDNDKPTVEFPFL